MEKLALFRYFKYIPKTVYLGLFLLMFFVITYDIVQAKINILTLSIYKRFEIFAYIYFIAFFYSVFLIIYGFSTLIKKQKEKLKNKNEILINLKWIIPYLFSVKKYKIIFIISSIIYGILFSFISAIIVYIPGANFSEIYNINIPSLSIFPVFGPPLQIPVLIVYLTNELGLIIIPLNFLLLLIVSFLVGLNISIISFLFSLNQSLNKSMFFSLGAFLGLFTACPTCASLILLSIIGGSVFLSLAVFLSTYQLLTIFVTIFLLLFSPIISLRILSKAVKNCCIVKK